ncbi:MAG: beta-galactosidase [Fervidobacterium sp.]|jgi:beta-galactosidase
MNSTKIFEKLLISAEIHYFRLPPYVWEDRILDAKKAGCNTISSYIPWLVHEQKENLYNFKGWYNLEKFIRLVQKHNLYFIIRPGPFVMAELKNEGIPYWIYEKYPHIKPKTWDGKMVENATVIYNHPDFLNEVKRWYSKIAQIVVKYLITNGGNIIAIQLDNEIGMLQWVTNSPDLSDFTLSRFVDWILRRNKSKEYSFELKKCPDVFEKLRSPEGDFREQFIVDYSKFSRYEFAQYVKNLKSIFLELGIDVPFIINIHGTSGGRAHNFPIGVSQLYDTFREPDIIPTTDIYIGTLSIKNFHDLWNINEVVKSTAIGKIYGSMEFECGNGNYGDDYSERIHPHSIIYKTLLSVLQGNRLINYYLFSGGINPKLDISIHDGNSRIGFTGERHGFAAPLSPDGEKDYSYHYLKIGNKVVQSVIKNNNNTEIEYDDVSVAFVKEYYNTEYFYKDVSKKVNLETHRGYNFWDSFLKGLLISGYRYNFVDIENNTPDMHKILIVPTAKYLSCKLQKKIADFISAGGKTILYGDLPIYNEYGQRCTILVDYLSVKPGREFVASHGFFPSISPSYASNLPKFPEFRTFWAREIMPVGDFLPIAEVTQSNSICSAYLKDRNAMILSAHYNCHYKLFKELLFILGTNPKCEVIGESKDVVGTYPFLIKDGKSVLVMNTDSYKKSIALKVGEKIFHEVLKPNEVKYRCM